MPYRAALRELLARRLEQERQALHAVDEATRSAAQEAKARRDLRYEHLGYPLRTRRDA